LLSGKSVAILATPMKFLIDTNIIIPMEPASTLDFEINTPLAMEFHRLAANTGKVKVGTLAAISGVDEDLVVGIVSDAGPLTNEFQKQFVRFWPWYLPLGVI
jgi:hypothetical protein